MGYFRSLCYDIGVPVYEARRYVVHGSYGHRVGRVFVSVLVFHSYLSADGLQCRGETVHGGTCGRRRAL
jgi:hypothetical protein